MAMYYTICPAPTTPNLLISAGAGRLVASVLAILEKPVARAIANGRATRNAVCKVIADYLGD